MLTNGINIVLNQWSCVRSNGCESPAGYHLRQIWVVHWRRHSAQLFNANSWGTKKISGWIWMVGFRVFGWWFHDVFPDGREGCVETNHFWHKRAFHIFNRNWSKGSNGSLFVQCWMSSLPWQNLPVSFFQDVILNDLELDGALRISANGNLPAKVVRTVAQSGES